MHKIVDRQLLWFKNCGMFGQVADLSSMISTKMSWSSFKKIHCGYCVRKKSSFFSLHLNFFMIWLLRRKPSSEIVYIWNHTQSQGVSYCSSIFTGIKFAFYLFLVVALVLACVAQLGRHCRILADILTGHSIILDPEKLSIEISEQHKTRQSANFDVTFFWKSSRAVVNVLCVVLLYPLSFYCCWDSVEIK